MGQASVSSSRRVLVLNASYEPLSLVPVRRAIVLLMQSKAEFIESGHQLTVRSVSRQWPLPLIIRLSRFVVVPLRLSPPTRNAVMLRDAHTCGYCGRAYNRSQMTIDHVVPRSRGGQHTWSNLITACQGCNQRKGQHRPEEANMRLRWKPEQPSYATLMLLRNPLAAARYRSYMAKVTPAAPA